MSARGGRRGYCPTMIARLLAGSALVVTALVGCSSDDPVTSAIRDGANKAPGVQKFKDCTGIAQDMASLRLDANATAQQLEQGEAKLRERVGSIQSDDVKAAADSLVARVDELKTAVARRDRSAVDAAVTKVRTAAGEVAKTCNLPIDRFLS